MCALAPGGVVTCWGSNAYGQLGHDPGDDLSCTSPLQTGPCSAAGLPVRGADGGTMNFTSIAASNYGADTCGLSGGEVYCWGANGTGQVQLPLSTTPIFVPTRVAGLPPATAIAMNGDLGTTGHACALDAENAVWCWGEVKGGASGAPDVSPEGGVNAPHRITFDDGGIVTATLLALGDRFGCGVVGQDVLCWGSHDGPAIADAAPDAYAAPLGGIFHSATLPWVHVAAGSDHVCASTFAGVACAGLDDFAQLGPASDACSSADAFEGPVCPPQQLAVGDVTALWVAAADTFVASKGTTYGWGWNGGGTLTLPPADGGCPSTSSNDCHAAVPIGAP